MRRGAVVPWAIAAVMIARTAPAEDRGTAEAEREYRLAQRMAADRSPEAATSFQRVVTLAPRGPLADDALVGLAVFNGAPDWPEDLGRLDPRVATGAATSLTKVVTEYAAGDRSSEARYRLALVRLAPLPGRDGARARQDLMDVAAGPRDTWSARARYALGVLDEAAGATDRAAGAYARVLVDQPDSDAASRAKAGFARTRLVRGRFGEAATWFQAVVESGAAPVLRAESGRELAIAGLIRDRAPGLRWSAATALPTTPLARGASLLAAAPDGALAVFNRKAGSLQIVAPSGQTGSPRAAEEVSALAADPYGRFWLASKESLIRADAGGLTTAVALGTFASPSAIAVDASGAVWLADRRGDRIGRWTPGTPAPALVHEEKGAGVTTLVVAGGGVVAAEERTGRLVAIAPSGSVVPFGAAAFKRPVALAVDVAGRISVLDEKAETVTRLSPAGEVLDVLTLPPLGIERPVGLAAAPDGTLRILDAATGSIAVTP